MLFCSIMFFAMAHAQACSPRVGYSAISDVQRYAMVVRGFVEAASIYRGSDGRAWIEIVLTDMIYVKGSDVRYFRRPYGQSTCELSVKVGDCLWIFANADGEFFDHYPQGSPLSPEFLSLEDSVKEGVIARKMSGLVLSRESRLRRR